MQDPRLNTITDATVYGLFDGPVLIYVGATTQPLPRRLSSHCKNVRQGDSREVYDYVRTQSGAENLSIEELGFDTEQEALDALGEDTLNANANAAETSYSGYDWTSEELDVLEEAENINEASRRLDASYNACRRAAIKLGLISGDQTYTSVDWDEWDYLLGTMTDADLADEIGCTTAAVQRRRTQLGIEARGSQALTTTEAAEVYLKSKTTDLTYADLAEDYGVSAGTIGQVVRGEGAYTEFSDGHLDDIVDRVNALLSGNGEGVEGLLDKALA